MNSILEKYKKDNSLLEKYQSKRQEPTILDNKGVSNQANPIYTYNQEQQYENILPDITNEEGQIIEEDADVFTKIIKTVASAGADVLYGASKGVEGIIDAGGILISKLDKGDTITDFVEKDWTNELLGDVKTSAHKDSFYSEDSIVSDVLVNVGQMLPSIALNVATGGTAGTIAFGLSAGGSGAEQALQEGATKDEAILYGTINGAVETAIEMLSGGLGGLGKGQITKLMPNLSMKMAKSTTTKVLVNMAGEGVEEMVSESLQPLMKSIYKDDALEEYKSDEFVGNVLEAGLTGALCSAVIMGGNVALTSKGSRVASNIVELQEEMIKQVEEGNIEQANELANEIISKSTEFSSEIEKHLSKKGTTINEILEQNELSEVSRLQSEIRDKNLKESKKEKISSRLSNLEANISEKVQRMNVEERKKYINRTAQNYKYNKDGSFKKSYLNADVETKAKQDYASEMIRNLNKITSSNFGLNFTNRKSVNGYVKGNVITLSNSLNNEELWKQAYAKTTGHELTHTTEGKNLYDLVFTNYFEKQTNNEEFKKEFEAKKNLYLNSNEKGLDAFKKMSAEKQDEYIKQEMFADVFGDMLSDKSLARKLVGDNRNTLQKLIDFFKERKENLDKFKGNKKLLKEYKKAINESFNIFTSLLKESENAVKVDNDGKEPATINENGVTKYNVKTFEQEGREMLINRLNKQKFSKEDINLLVKRMDDAVKFTKELMEKYPSVYNSQNMEVYTAENGHTIVSAWVKNSDYRWNIDLTTICKKREAYTAILDKVLSKVDFNNADFSQKNLVKLNVLLSENGIETACPLCFVDAKRYNIESWAKDLTQKWNEVAQMNDEQLKKKIGDYKNEKANEGKEVKGKVSPIIKVAQEMLKNPSKKELIKAEDLMDSSIMTRLKKEGKDLLYYWVLNAHGVATPKPIKEYQPYNNELLNNKETSNQIKKSSDRVQGIRLFSFSDFKIEDFFDYIQLFSNLEARQLKLQSYTKEIAFAEIFGQTGAKINLSLVPLVDKSLSKEMAGLDINGNLIYDKEHSVDIKKSFELINKKGYKGNVGTILVGVSDLQIRKALADKNISYVIPYHKSSLNPIVAQMYNISKYNDYTDSQRTTNKKTGNAIDTKLEFAFYDDLAKTQNPKQTAKNYLNWCKQNNYIPKFNQFSKEPNYYKLLIDFQVYNGNVYAPQENVKLKLPNNYKEIIESYISERQEKLDYTSEKIDELSEQITDLFTKKETKYSLKEDSEGNELSEKQIEFFKNSKVVDEEGRLLRMYHGSDYAGFMKFNNDSGFYFFTPDYEIASTYTRTSNFVADKSFKNAKELINWFYLEGSEELQIPSNMFVDIMPVSDAKEQIEEYKNALINASKEKDQYDFLNKKLDIINKSKYVVIINDSLQFYTEKELINEAIPNLQQHINFELYDEDSNKSNNIYETYLNITNPFILNCRSSNFLNIKFRGETKSTDEIAEIIKKEGNYDGIIFKNIVDNGARDLFNNLGASNVYVAFNSNQIKSVNNENPTKTSDDIRYSVKSPTLSKVKTVTTQANQNKINAFKKGTEQLKIAFVDSMAGVNNIIKLYTENKDNYEVKANLLRGFKNRADYSLQNGIRNLKGDKVLSKSYDEIFNWMDTEQKRTEYYDYLLHNHNVDRMNLFKKVTAKDIQKLNFLTDYKKAKMIKKISDSKQESLSIEEFKSFMNEKQFNEFKEVFRDSKPVFGNDVTAQDSLDIISEYDKKYPEFKEHAKDVWKFADALNRLRLESGLIDVNQYREMASVYPHYVPTEREIQSTLLSKPVAGSSKNVSTGVKKAKGSDILIKPLHEQFKSQLKRVYKNIAVNEMAKDIYDAKMNSKYKDTNQDVRIIEQIKIRKTVDEYTEEELGERGNVVSFYKDGERISIEVTNEILEGFNTLSSVNDYSNNLILKPINKANKLFKAFTTEYNPFFILRNFSRDIQDALLYSKNGIKTLSKNMPKAFQEILKNGEIWQRYCAMGGLYSSFFDFNNGIIVNKPLSKPNILNPKNALSKVKNKIARANMIVEQSVRIAEFISSLENGKSYEEAFYDAQEITVNFGRSGKATRFLNSTIMPFLNAQVQGFVKLYRTVFSRKTLRELSSLLARAILIGLTPSLFNYIVYYDDDEYQGLSDYYRDNNYLIKIGDKFVKIPKGRVVTVLSSALTKSADYILKGDKTAFEGYGDTVSQAVSPVNDFRTILSPINDVKTNTTWYGGQIESSKYDNIRPSDRYDESTSAISKALGKVFNYSPKKIDYLIDQYSGIIGDALIPATNSDGKTNALTFVSSNLTVDPVYKTKYYQDFSKKLTKLQYLKSDGDAVATLQVKYMNKVKSKISELYDEQRKIEEDTSLSKKEKDEQLKTIQLLINNMYKTAYENVDALGSNLNQLQLSEDSIDDDYYYGLYLTFGAETALKFHSTKLYEKASNLVGNSSLTYDDFLLTYFDCKGMKKSEAKAYIQSLPMSKSNKQKLFESLF